MQGGERGRDGGSDGGRDGWREGGTGRGTELTISTSCDRIGPVQKFVVVVT